MKRNALFARIALAWAVGVAGHPLAKTPHMDALFKSGAYLPNAYTVTPVCSPSRASMMTSRYGTELGITDWIKPYQLWDPENELGGTDPSTARYLAGSRLHRICYRQCPIRAGHDLSNRKSPRES